MATIRLVPSTYAVSNASYVTVTDPENMYTNTDSTTYASLRNTRNSTSNTYYVYIRGFNFDDVPTGAQVSSFTIKLRGYESYMSTSSSYRMSLYNGTTAISNTTVTSSFSTTNTTFTFPNGSLDWSTLSGYGANFGIRVPLRRSSTSYNSYIYVYGAEIEVTYTVPNPRTLTVTLSGSGTVTPSGTSTVYDGDEISISIVPTNSSDTVTVKKNNVDVTADVEPPGSESEERVLGTYALVSGSFNGSGASYFQGLVGKGHTNTQTTTNYYSGGNGTIAVFTYDMGVEVPSSATVTECYVMVNGHAESTSQSSEYMCAQLLSGSTAITAELNFKSVGTSNSTQTLQATTLPTPAQCENLKLQCRLGYYGGAINGATLYLTYQHNNYLYTFIVSGDTTIAVVIGGGTTAKIYYKNGSSWVAATKVYKKVNGSWVEQSDLTTVFNSTTNYRKG